MLCYILPRTVVYLRLVIFLHMDIMLFPYYKILRFLGLIRIKFIAKKKDTAWTAEKAKRINCKLASHVHMCHIGVLNEEKN